MCVACSKVKLKLKQLHKQAADFASPCNTTPQTTLARVTDSEFLASNASNGIGNIL